MANNNLAKEYDTSGIETRNMAQTIEDNKNVAESHRKQHSRRWYDNNFFDDGYHFRYLDRTTNKIVDLSERATIYAPQRAIPKASRQIRGIANLLLSSDPTPTVYPEEAQAEEDAKALKEKAKKQGYWLQEEWREADTTGETIIEKLAFAMILTMKHSISYIKIWPDRDEKIKSAVRDAFDMYVIGSYNAIEDLPFMIEATPMLVSQIKSNQDFDKEGRSKVMSDNKAAESDIKQAYLRSQYGRDSSSDVSGTAILSEAYMKEYLNEENVGRIKEQKDANIILKNRKMGDKIVRQVFTASSQVLLDKYLNMDSYPYVDVRLEPGPLYQVSLIERFKDANKSLDSAVTRMERYFHTMVTGIWLKRRGEQFKINNISGGQVIEYDQTAPVQANLASPGQWTFEFMNLLTSFIEEQGVSTTLGNIPTGVKAHAAIESMKEQEYANLVIASRRLKEVCRRIAIKMFTIADDNFVTPKSVSYTSGNDTNYFQVIGKSALERRNQEEIETPENLISLSADAKIDIEISQGMAYTREGKKESMQNLINTMLEYAQAGLISPDSIKVVVQKYLEIYQFGSTAEFMEALDTEGLNQGMGEAQLMQIKTAVLEALKEVGEVGEEASKKRVMENKMGTLQALKESGLAKNIQEAAQSPIPDNPEVAEIPYDKAPRSIQAQMEAAAGFTPATDEPTPVQVDQELKAAEIAIKAKQANKPQPKKQPKK